MNGREVSGDSIISGTISLSKAAAITQLDTEALGWGAELCGEDGWKVSCKAEFSYSRASGRWRQNCLGVRRGLLGAEDLSLRVDQNRPRIGQLRLKLLEIAPDVAKFAKRWSTLITFVHNWSESTRIWPMVPRVRRNRARIGRIQPRLGRNRANIVHIRPNSAQIFPEAANIADFASKFDRRKHAPARILTPNKCRRTHPEAR